MSTGRTYAGVPAEERVARRRAQLVDAGLRVFGTDGFHRATVRQLCREARVADRYFYEEFSSTEDLLVAVYHHCMDRIVEASLGAVAQRPSDAPLDVLAHAGLDGLLAVVEGQPALARIVWFEVLGVSERVESTHLARQAQFGELLRDLLVTRDIAFGDRPHYEEAMMTAVVGGISQAVMLWIHRGFDVERAELVAALADFMLAVADRTTRAGA